jgi:chitodextrinase
MKFHLKHTYNQNFNYNDAVEMCNELMKENYNSVNYRYVLNDTPTTFNFIDLDNAKELTPVETIKAVDCLNYQSCEHPTWEKSKAYKFLKEVKYSAINNLPGYDEAEWGIN